MSKLFLIAILGLSTLLFYQWKDYDKSAPFDIPAPASSSEGDSTDSESGEQQSLLTSDYEAFSEIYQRPLFIDGRRQPEPQPVEIQTGAVQPKVMAKRPTLNLTAVMIFDDKKYAIFSNIGRKTKNKSNVVKLQQGEEFEGWKLVKIEQKQAILRSGANSEVFLLREYKKVPLPKPERKRPQPRSENKKERQSKKSAAAPAKG